MAAARSRQGGGVGEPSGAIVAAPSQEAIARLLDLPLTVEEVALSLLRSPVSSGFARLTTLFYLRGKGEEGVGEDVTYEAADHLLLRRRWAAGWRIPLCGRFTLRRFCRYSAGLSLHPAPPRHQTSLPYRRWAVQSAALDLALRQAGLSLAEAVGLTVKPVHFVLSLNLGEPPALERLTKRLARYPDAALKVDPTPSWTEEVIARLREGGRVAVLDFKAHYDGTPVDQRPPPALYRTLLQGFPEALLEDPCYGPETAALLNPHLGRIAYDAPLQGVADLARFGHPVAVVNIKPSRLGGVEELFALLTHCARAGIRAYGGGQFELGAGRGQVQYLASLFYAAGPNDVAPTPYNLPNPPAGLPQSPLRPTPAKTGFRFN